MKKIPFLIIEDDDERIRKMEQWLPDWARLAKVTCGGRAKFTLQQTSLRIPKKNRDIYAGILLDHDLVKQTITSVDGDISGEAIAHYIVRYVPQYIPILIHSMNPLGTLRMRGLLEAAGFYVTRIAMEKLNRNNFIEWIEEAKQIMEENDEN